MHGGNWDKVIFSFILVAGNLNSALSPFYSVLILKKKKCMVSDLKCDYYKIVVFDIDVSVCIKRGTFITIRLSPMMTERRLL